MIGFSRTAFTGKYGHRYCMPYGSYTGTQNGSQVVLGTATSERKALAAVLRDEWNTPGRTLTLTVEKWNGVSWDVVTSGTTSSGPSTVKDVAQPNPAMPMHALPALTDGTFRVTVITDGVLRYSSEIVG